ncbi:MAG: hypothetical protein EON56_05830 [Alphaproteobacteria bacterium]|nr:MAG: hypothetical protein EON56_05830 [Alphaproteobacteria bacterium]
MFEGLTPPTCVYFAGHARGESYRCLQWYGVGVGSDPLVGTPPDAVDSYLEALASKLADATARLDKFIASSEQPVSRQVLLSALVPIAAYALEVLLTIHPYANGNGHMGRLLVFVLFARYGVWPEGWTLDVRPPYSPLLSAHRRGDVAPLQTLLYQSIIGPSAGI